MIINLTQSAMTKLLALSNASGKDEIGGILIGYLESHQIIITDITVPKQKVTAASISFDDDSINEQLSELFFNESDAGFVGWWHTHGTGKTFWSTVDQKDGIDKFLQPLIDNVDGSLTNKWIVSIVANARGDLLGRIDYYSLTPFGSYVETINDVPVVCLPIISKKQIEAAKKVIQENVSKSVCMYTPYYNGKWKKWNKYYDIEDADDGIYCDTAPVESQVVQVQTFTEEDEELIKIATSTYNIHRETIEDLVNLGYSVANAIDVLLEEEIV